MLTAHWQNLSLPTPNSSSPTPESIQELRRKLQETRKLNLALRSAAKRNNADLEQLRALVSPTSTALKTEQSPSPAKQQSTTGAFTFLTHSDGAKALGISPITAGSTSNEAATGPLETNTSFTLSQLPALRALLDDLRPKLAGLGSATAGVRDDEMARERRLYIENQTRKALERRGVEIGGEAEATGRKVGPDELAALESITEGLRTGDRMEE
jgi:kinetochore protein Mis12/MTW1